MAFIAKQTKDLSGIIGQAYAPGGDHIDKWLNVAGSGVDNCIKDQVAALTGGKTLVFFRVDEAETFVGYFGSEFDGSWLSTIFIVPKYRPRKVEFWTVVKNHMKPVFKNAGFHKNVPACNFYRKMGGKEIGRTETEHGPITMFEYGKDAEWQLQLV